MSIIEAERRATPVSVTVNVGGQRREVHTDLGGRRVMFCQNPTQ